MKKRAICTIHSLKHKVNVKLYHNIISLYNKKWRQNLGLQHLLIEFRYDSQPALGISQSNSLHFLFFSQFSVGSSWLVSRLGIKQHTCLFLYFNFAFFPYYMYKALDFRFTILFQTTRFASFFPMHQPPTNQTLPDSVLN